LPRIVPAIVFLSVLALGVALMFFADARVATYLNEQGIAAALRQKGSSLRILSEVLKQPGEWYIALTAAVIVTLFPPKPWRAPLPLETPPAAGGRYPTWTAAWPATLFVVLSALAASANVLFKWIAGRQRPLRGGQFFGDALTFSPFRGGLPGFFDQTNLSLPSGHATSAFALAAALCILYPRLSPLFVLAATATATERVLTNSHYPSEVLLAALLGTTTTLLIAKLFKPKSTDRPS